MRKQLQGRILSFIRTDGKSEPFEGLALDLHKHQHRHDQVLRALLAKPAENFAQIPAVPVGLFRHLDVGTVDPDEPHQAFHTSGTTGTPGVHRMLDTHTYDAGCQRWARHYLPETTHTVALLTNSPHSSLAHMIRGFGSTTGNITFVTSPEEANDVLRKHQKAPVFLCTTAFALDAWLSTPLPLPAGSRIFTTGGFKGHSHNRDPTTLVRAAEQFAPVVLEYGMTELSSQLWARPGEPYAPPPWLRVTAVDPITGHLLPSGEAGQLRFVDLCNLDSTVHIETLDHGRVFKDGRLELLGRLPDAPLRGCSLTDEDLLQ